MQELHRRDMLTFCDVVRGEKPLTQVVYMRIYDAELRGEQWSLAGIGRDAGASGGAVKSACDALVEKGMLRAREARQAPYAVLLDFVPVQRAAPPTPTEAKKKQAPPPMWAVELSSLWAEAEGAVGPRMMERRFAEAVELYGEARVLNGMKNYIAGKQGMRNTFDLAEHIKYWIEHSRVHGPSRAPGGVGFADRL